MIFNALTFVLMALLILSMLPIGESRRVAWSGLTMQRSCAAFSICVLSARVHTDDLRLGKVQMQSKVLSCIPHCMCVDCQEHHPNCPPPQGAIIHIEYSQLRPQLTHNAVDSEAEQKEAQGISLLHSLQ